MSSRRSSLTKLEQHDDFVRRHIGPSDDDIEEMLASLGMDSLQTLVERALPPQIRTREPLPLPPSRSEADVVAQLRRLAAQNRQFKSFIGLGYAGTFTPRVILRNVLENPGWYTSYTPYQAEISQGRLEALLNFQTMVTDLTGMEIANASLLDEATAAAEAMTMCFARQRRRRNLCWVAEDCHPQTLEVLQTRAGAIGIDIELGRPQKLRLDSRYFAVIVQYPGSSGALTDYSRLAKVAHQDSTLVIVASDLLSLTLLKPPGEWGADVVVGSSQRFGVPMGFGGPHAAFFASREVFKRSVPGRIVGVSRDAAGKPALRLALQTREQHIRREKATSNICTAQVLLAVMAGMYAVYHGPSGLETIARRVNCLARILAAGLSQVGLNPIHDTFFDTLSFEVDSDQRQLILQRASEARINLRSDQPHRLGVSLDETTLREDVAKLWKVLVGDRASRLSLDEIKLEPSIPAYLRRTSEFLTHSVFHRFHSETEMLRYLHRLQEKDLSLTKSMIPLGSCTMKLNATVEMEAVTWPGFANIHPFAPLDQASGYRHLIDELEAMLAKITGFAAISVQPNAGSQGEFAGLLLIRRYLKNQGEGHRNICLIPSSAHGTNPASAAMAGLKVVVVACDSNGNIDLTDLQLKAEQHRDHLAALMVTYPSTHGVFEEGMVEICQIVHRYGGQVYMDGANLNALVGLAQPGRFGPDVAHLNLHKTFCIPHGGGGPGVGPIGVAAHLAPLLPTHGLVPEAGPKTGISAVSAAPWGSSGILPISWAYIALMGGTGLTKATQVAILNANYVAARLEPSYPVLYRGRNGTVAHECIVDIRPLKASAGIDVDDIAKRLMDYGFHAPTMSFPVAGTLMIEPTESESRIEMDRFCEAMISIREEIRRIEEGVSDPINNPVKQAPHTLASLVGDWNYPYSRREAVFPLPWVGERKFWPTVGRIDNLFGDRTLVCSCPPVEAYADK